MRDLENSILRVRHRYLVRLAARQALPSSNTRLASAGFTHEVLAAFGEHFMEPSFTSRVAFLGLVKKLKQLASVFGKIPKLWGKFKELLGIESLADIPKAIGRFAETGKAFLKKALNKVFGTWPLKLYTLEKGKLQSFSQMLDSLLGKFPAFKDLVDRGARKLGDWGEMLREKAPHIAGAVMAAIYLWVWLNVVEFEWDLKSFTEAISGLLTFPDFLSSLPGSAFGLLLRPLGVGTFTLLPYAVAARILYLLGHRYIEWKDGFHVHWDLLKKDFGVEPA